MTRSATSHATCWRRTGSSSGRFAERGETAGGVSEDRIGILRPGQPASHRRRGHLAHCGQVLLGCIGPGEHRGEFHRDEGVGTGPAGELADAEHRPPFPPLHRGSGRAMAAEVGIRFGAPGGDRHPHRIPVLPGPNSARAAFDRGRDEPPGLAPGNWPIRPVRDQQHLVPGRVVQPVRRRDQRVSPRIRGAQRPSGPPVEMPGHLLERRELDPLRVQDHGQQRPGG